MLRDTFSAIRLHVRGNAASADVRTVCHLEHDSGEIFARSCLWSALRAVLYCEIWLNQFYVSSCWTWRLSFDVPHTLISALRNVLVLLWADLLPWGEKVSIAFQSVIILSYSVWGEDRKEGRKEGRKKERKAENFALSNGTWRELYIAIGNFRI